MAGRGRGPLGYNARRRQKRGGSTSPHDEMRLFLKRVFDVTLASISLLLLALPVVAFAFVFAWSGWLGGDEGNTSAAFGGALLLFRWS